MRSDLWTVGVLIWCLGFAQAAHAGTEPVPKAAQEVIDQVHRAAQARNYDKLRQHMVADFTWSFGGDGSADQAIEAWKAEASYLRSLAKVTRLKCIYRKDRYVECPFAAGTSHRAGFRQGKDGWKFEYFVAGD